MLPRCRLALTEPLPSMIAHRCIELVNAATMRPPRPRPPADSPSPSVSKCGNPIVMRRRPGRCRHRRRDPDRASRSPHPRRAAAAWDDLPNRNQSDAISEARPDEHARLGPRGVKKRRRMTLREHEPIVVMELQSFASKRISPKNSAATRSAAEQQLVGCPAARLGSRPERVDSKARRNIFQGGNDRCTIKRHGGPVITS